jgi:enoyl-CoA hydratase
VEQQGRVRRIIFDRPDKLNAMNGEMRTQWFAAIDEATADDGTHVIVLSGNGRAFSSGADLKASGGGGSIMDAPADMVHNKATVDQWLRLWALPKPVIAQVHGYCLGMANDIVACADIVICGESAKIGMPEVREFALPPTLGFWPLKLGLNRTKELLWTGRFVDGKEAAELGLANQTVPDDELGAVVDALAANIAEVKLPLLQVSKQAANNWFEVFGLRAAAMGGAEYHAIFHQASSWDEMQKGS